MPMTKDIAGYSFGTRVIGGVRVERFDQTVTTQDPFGLFAREVQANLKNTDLFPGVNFVQALTPSSNLRISYSTTVNRPEFRELAEFEFTDVIGNRAVKGNANLQRALIQNVDGRWEMFSGGRGVIAAATAANPSARRRARARAGVPSAPSMAWRMSAALWKRTLG